jgi:hypothetical protein
LPLVNTQLLETVIRCRRLTVTEFLKQFLTVLPNLYYFTYKFKFFNLADTPCLIYKFKFTSTSINNDTLVSLNSRHHKSVKFSIFTILYQFITQNFHFRRSTLAYIQIEFLCLLNILFRHPQTKAPKASNIKALCSCCWYLTLEISSVHGRTMFVHPLLASLIYEFEFFNFIDVIKLKKLNIRLFLRNKKIGNSKD